VKDAMAELVQKYSRAGHPSAEELIATQGLTFPRDPRDLLGNFWPEEESLDDFLAAVTRTSSHSSSSPTPAHKYTFQNCKTGNGSFRS
jgi:hypothetical protein